MKALKVGDPMDAATEVGPLATAEAVTALQADVDATVKAGARVLTGGKPVDGPGSFYAPTVLTGIPKESPGYGEELFGPVACVFRRLAA
jgi:succinate-semialdehyde dehydrogenase/glutarate-semialdehyde dehydrogenase